MSPTGAAETDRPDSGRGQPGRRDLATAGWDLTVKLASRFALTILLAGAAVPPLVARDLLKLPDGFKSELIAQEPLKNALARSDVTDESYPTVGETRDG